MGDLYRQTMNNLALAEQGRAERKQNAFASLSSQAFGAAPEQRNALIQQAVALDPNAGMALGKTLEAQDENIASKAAGAARYVLNAVETKNPAAVQGAYQAVRPFLARIGAAHGKVPPEQWSDDMLPMLHQVVAAANGGAVGPSGLQEFNAMTQGLTPEEVARARRVKLGLDPRAVTGAAKTFTQPDENGIPTTYTFDPATRSYVRADINGVPLVGRPKEAEAAAVRAAESNVDLQYKPSIAGAEAGAKTAAELQYAPQTAAAAGQKAGAEASAKAAAERDATQAQRAVSGARTLDLLDQAESLIGQSTGSLAGSIYDRAAGAVGESTPGAEAIASLRTLSGQLVSMMPRMEGPQSDHDVQMYKEMAGDLANPNIPRPQRLAALRTIRLLNEKYATPQRRATDRPAGGTPRRVSNAADYNALPSGAQYIAPDGSVRRKK